jgi:hypothetical protein
MGSSSDKNDKTQMLSDSQVVEVKPATVDKNDRSVWLGRVVGADEFAPPPVQKSSSAKWVVLAVLVLGAGGAGAYWFHVRGGSHAAVPVDAVPSKPDAAPPPDAARPADAAIDAPVDAAPTDAAVEDAGVDAGVSRPPLRKKLGPAKRRPPPKRKLQ